MAEKRPRPKDDDIEHNIGDLVDRVGEFKARLDVMVDKINKLPKKLNRNKTLTDKQRENVNDVERALRHLEGRLEELLQDIDGAVVIL